MTTAIAEYSATEAALTALESAYKTVVFDVQVATGMEQARKARAEIRGYRVSLEDMRKELKAPVIERGRLLDAEARRITARLEALEDPIDEQIKNEERRREQIRREAFQAEEQRKGAIRAKIKAITQRAIDVAFCKDLEEVDRSIRALDAYDILGEDFGEFLDEAVTAKGEAMRMMSATLVEIRQLAHEQAEAQRKQREEAETLRIEREKIEAATAQLRKANGAQMAHIAAEQAQIAAERAKVEAQAKAQREAAEAEKAAQAKQRAIEQARLKAQKEAADRMARENTLPPGDEIVWTVAQQFGVSDAVALKWLRSIDWSTVAIETKEAA